VFDYTLAELLVLVWGKNVTWEYPVAMETFGVLRVVV